MFEVMLIGLLVLVLILIPLCIGFVAIVRWIMRRTRRVSGQTPVTAAEPLPPPGAAEKGVVRTRIPDRRRYVRVRNVWRAGGSFRKGPRTSVARGGCCGDAEQYGQGRVARIN